MTYILTENETIKGGGSLGNVLSYIAKKYGRTILSVLDRESIASQVREAGATGLQVIVKSNIGKYYIRILAMRELDSKEAKRELKPADKNKYGTLL